MQPLRTETIRYKSHLLSNTASLFFSLFEENWFAVYLRIVMQQSNNLLLGVQKEEERGIYVDDSSHFIVNNTMLSYER